MSRFILNLRLLDQTPQIATISVGSGPAEPLHFAAPEAFGNLGSPLDVDDRNHHEINNDEEDEELEESLIQGVVYDTESLNEYRPVRRSGSVDL